MIVNSWPNTTYEGASQWRAEEKLPGTIATNSLSIIYTFFHFSSEFSKKILLLHRVLRIPTNCFCVSQNDPADPDHMRLSAHFHHCDHDVFGGFRGISTSFLLNFLPFQEICNTISSDCPNFNRIRLGNAFAIECRAESTKYFRFDVSYTEHHGYLNAIKTDI